MTSFLDRLLGRPEQLGVQLDGRGTSITKAGSREVTVAQRGDAWREAVKATMGDAWLTAYQQGGINLSSMAMDPQDKAAKLLQAYKCGWFNKAERKISTDFAGLVVALAPEDEEGDNQEDEVEADLLTPWRQLDPIEQFLRLMEKPNPYQTGRQLRQKTMIRLDMAGWAFWYTELGTDGLVAEDGIYGISPSRLWPSYDSGGRLIGWVMDKNRPSGGVPFDVNEIIPFTYGSAEEDLVYGIGVVEAVWAQLPLTDMLARHTADVLSTGGRLAGAMWPKERALDEAEFEDAKRAWRNVASDPNAARRLLIFPEPMEWSQGSATPEEIGIPELAALNRDDILTAFPISPYQLGVPMPGGLNSAATRKEDRLDYWQGTIHPRVELFEETIQTYLVPRYEEVVGFTLDFEVEEPNLDDAPALIEKVGALKALIDSGFDEKEAVSAVGLEHIKFVGKPEPVAPPVPTEPVVSATTQGGISGDQTSTGVNVSKGTKAARVVEERDQSLGRMVPMAQDRLVRFFEEQRQRVEEAWRKLPSTKAERAAKADPTWWDGPEEDRKLTETMRGIYLSVGRSGLQAVADNLDRVIVKGLVGNVLADLLTYGGQRIKDINDRTLQALTLQLAEGTRRGYSINQLIDGVPDEGYTGVAGVALDNGTPAFDPYRAEMIARTETMLSYNRATVTSYGEFGVTHLLAYDGDQDEECAARDGQEFTVEEAADIEDHPNGTLVWSPVVDKAWHESDLMSQFLEAIKAVSAPTPVYITMPNPPDIHFPEVSVPVNVAAAEVNVPPTVVNVTTPEVVANFSSPAVTVEAAEVNVPPTLVTVNVPEQTIVVQPSETTVVPGVVQVNVPEAEPPIVNVSMPEINVEAPAVTVQMPEPRPVTKTIKRDRKGQITHIEER